MPKSKETLSSKFNIEQPATAVTTVVVPTPVVPTLNSAAEIIDADAAKARATITSLIDKGLVALQQLSDVAADSEQPRAYEVMSTMIKTISDLSKDLLEVQKTKQTLEPEQEQQGTKIQNQQNNFFVGSTQELLRSLEQLNAQPTLTATAHVIEDAEVVEHG